MCTCWFGEEQEVGVLGVEGVVVEQRRRQRAELVELEAAGLAHETLPGAVLLAPHAHEQVREVEAGQPVLRVAEVHDLAVILRLGLARLGVGDMFGRWHPAAESSRVSRHAPAAHVACALCLYASLG